MTSPYAKMRFSVIETTGTLPDGRIIQRTVSYPEGASYEEYMRLDGALVRAFGVHKSVTRGLPIIEENHHGHQR